MSDSLFAAQLAQTAQGHRNLAATADTDAECAHWTSEAERFEELAALAQHSPHTARVEYRPTRTYEPA